MKRIISIALSFILVFTLCPSVFAAGNTITWNGKAGDRSWDTADNWTPEQVPEDGDTAVIPAFTVAEVVYDTTSVTLDCFGEVSVESGKTLWLTGTSYLKGGGKLSGDGNITIMVDDSELQWSGGSIEGNGTFTVEQNTRLVIDTTRDVGMSRFLENNGQVMLTTGDLYLSGGSTGTGTFTVSGGASLYFEQGEYSIGGDFVNSGDVTIWNTSSVSFNAGYRQDSTGTLALKVWGSGSNEYCKLDVAGAAELGGILEIDFINDYDPQVGDTFEIMTCGSRAGEFSEINSNMEGITLVPAYTDTGLTLTVSDGTTPEENVCEIGENKYTTLDSALSEAISGQTIKLLKSIDYDHSIEIVNKSITFDLNGFNLNILNTTGGGTIEENSGLYVKGNAAVSFEGEGEFNVTGTWYGVFAERDSESGGTPSVTVTNATGIGRDGVAAQYSKVTVKGDATSRGSTYSGVWASYENAEVIVEGDVYANGEMSMGVNTDTLASVTVKGSVIVDGDNSIGIKASDDGDVTVEGNVTVSGIDCIGVSFLSVVDQPSIVTIKGVIEAEKYILFEAEDESKWEYSLRDGDFDEETADYIYYTKDNVSFVYVSMFAGGSGTVEDPYLIAHATQLYNIKYYHLFDKHYKQIADIDLGGYFSLGEGWDPIGLGESPFLGVYDGDGHTISNLFITRPYQGDIGLFGCVGEHSEILNVGLINADVTGRREVGGLAAINAGLIANSYVTGKVSGTTYAGGLIGYNIGSVTDSYFDGTVVHVKGFDTDEVECAGGLVGDNFEGGSITGCYAKATVESEGPLIGGLAGGNLGSITDSHAISDVTGYYYVGGLTGDNGGIINNSYADGTVTGASQAGGLVGLNGSLHPITNSYFTGTVTASDDYTGGLVGENSGGTIRNCHADATVTSTGDYVGGLAGRSIGLITSSYSTGVVTGGNHVGGLVGASFINAGSGGISEISASYSACAVEGEMYVGGLAGSNETPISESYAKGDVTKADEVDFTYTHFGGLVGKNTGPIGDSYAWGDVSGHQYVGGLMGYNEADVTNCYEIGAVSGNSNTGGLIGSNLSGSEITGSFWNNNTSGQDSSDGGESKGSVMMKQQVTYVNEGWDFDTIWDIDLVQPHAFNDGYPFLRWQVDAEFAGGSGTLEDPYLIATADQLYNVRNHLDKHYKLIENIDMSGYSTDKGWEPIGGEYTPFTGSFDGNGKVINNLFISRGTSDYVGLFGYTGKTAEIRNLGLENAGTTGKNFVGSLIGYSMGKIMNSYSAGNVNGSQFVGGLVGYNFREGLSLGGTITSSYSLCTVTAIDFDAGGLAGRNARGVIANSFATGNVSSPVSVGGLVGASVGEVGNKNVGLITNSYSTGEVSATVQDAGGLVGQNSALISYSFATGRVSCPKNVGGLAGYIYNWGRTENSYWDTITSDQNASAGGGTGKTTAEMKQQITYEGWDFDTIWGINSSKNNGYPFLRWQGYEAEPTAPSAPQTFTATPGDGQVALSWSASASDGGAAIIRYEVSSDNGGTWVTAATNTSHIFTGLTNGTAYTFKVRAVNSAGNGAEASATATPIAALTAPTVPQNFTATPSDGQVALSWAAPASDGGAAIIRYEVSSDNGGTWVTAATNTSHTFTGLTNGTEYTFKVRAVNSAGNGAEASVSATVLVPGFAGGDGSEASPYLIAIPEHLNNVRNYLGAGHTNKHFKLTANLDLNVAPYNSGAGWAPIGTSTNPFTGAFDGDGYTISNLFVKQAGAWNVRIPAGLFGYTGVTAGISNLSLESVDVTGCYYVGSLVGNNSGDITNVSVSGNVTGEWDTGGLVGLNNGLITGSCFMGDVTGDDIVEYGDWTGGLVGYNSGAITDCWVATTVVSEGDNVGGLVGENLTEGIITESYSAGDVTADDYTGGLVGSNSGEITACYSICTVSGGSYVGGLVGSGNDETVTDCYWDTETSGQSTSEGGTGKITADMKHLTTFENWDFITVWDINTSFNNGYPILRWLVDVPPVLSETGVNSVTDTTAALSFTSDKSGIYYYLVYDAAEDAPDAAAIKVQGEAAAKGTGIAEAAVNNVTMTDLTASTEYKTYIIVEYAERNTSDIAEIGFTTEAASITPTVPIAPQNFTATPSDGQVALSWAAPASDGGAAIIRYEVSSDNGGTWVTAATNTSHTFTGLTNGTEYTFKVRAVNSAGNGAEASVSATPTAALTVPTVPQNFAPTPGDGQVALSWTAPASDGGAAIIRYEVSSDNGGTWVTAATNTSHIFTGLTNGTAYTFKVRAVNSVGNGAEASATATPTAAPALTYTVVVTNGTGGGEFAQGVTVTITANSAPDKQRFKEWQVISGGITLVNSQEASTSFQMPANAVEVAATYETIPETTYTVTVNGSYAAATGAGSYAHDVTVTIDAGSRSSYTFAGWTSPDGVTFMNTNNATTTFTMPDKNVTITANWSYNGSDGGSSGGESSIPTTPAAPAASAYKADVKEGSGAETTVPVTVDKDAGTASVDAGSQGLNQRETVITIPSIPDVDTYSVGIPVPDLSTSDVQGTLTVNTDAGSVTILSNMLTGVSGISGSKADIVIGQGDKDNLPDTVKAAIGDRPLVQLTLSIDGKQTDWSNPDAPVTVSIPYTPTAAELSNPESIVVWYIDGSGNAISVPNGHYDPTTGMVTFDATHFSEYAVAYNKVSFNDVTAGAWYAKAVSFIAAREITAGTGGGNFSPEAKLTRGQFIVMLMKAYGIAPDADPKNNFADAGATYYTGYLAAAKRVSISSGVGNNMFAPEKEITRQEMFTLLYNALKIIGQLPKDDSGKTLDHFSDAGQIDPWAKEAMTLMVKTGTIGGNAGKLNPTSTTTRAEMAQVLYNLLLK